MIKKTIQFIRINALPLIGISIGTFLGYLHWFLWGCYWGTYSLSSECWVNCTYGALFFGYIILAIFKNDQTYISKQ